MALFLFKELASLLNVNFALLARNRHIEHLLKYYFVRKVDGIYRTGITWKIAW